MSKRKLLAALDSIVPDKDTFDLLLDTIVTAFVVRSGQATEVGVGNALDGWKIIATKNGRLRSSRMKKIAD